MNNIKETYGRNLGLFQSPYDPEQWKFKDAVPLAAFRIPDNYISENVELFGFDQKNSSQCAASAYSYIRMLQEHGKEQSELTEPFCPTWSYGKRIDGAYVGEGMLLSDVVKGGRKFGSVLFEELEYPCSYPAAKYLVDRNTGELLTKGAPFRISSYYTCNSRREIQIAIMETKGVLIGIPCYDSVFEPDAEGKVRFIKGQENSGGHAVVLVGWSTDDEGFWWIVKNSWGKYTKYADGSMFLLHESYPWMDQAYVIVDNKTDMKFKEYKEKFYGEEQN